jgi:TatD DNase family protein
MVQWTDIGVNLTHDSFTADRESVIERAQAAQVHRMIITGASRTSTHLAVSLSQRYTDSLYATAGVHPHHAAELEETTLAEYQTLANQQQIVALGECGLDYFRDYCPHHIQQRAFHKQLELAEKVAKPLFLHQRDAHADFIAILREHPAALRQGAVVHCFTGQWVELQQYLEMGLFIGITGWICDERRGQHLLEAVRHIPAGRLLLETDAPYLLPRTLKPKPASRRNEPAFLPHIAEVIARARHESLEQLAAHTHTATQTLFRFS